MACSEVQKQVLRMELDKGGAFDFSNCIRNMALARMGAPAPRVRSTGTTIVAATYKGGLVMGADSRATAGNIIADKHCEKVHYLTDSIYACGAGTAADLDQVTKMLSGSLRLMELNTGRKARVITALRHAKQHLFNYQGYVGAYLLIGGVDPTGPHLYECSANGTTMAKPFAAQGSGSYAAISVLERDFKTDMSVSGVDPTGPHLYECSANGTTMAKPFAAQGSGSYAAISVLERDFKTDMSEEDAVNLVQRALHAGMHGDNASGNSLNLVIMRPGKTEFKGPIVPDFCKKPEPIDLPYKFKTGSTKVLKRKMVKFDVIESMDVSH
ncbi:unnamed protein product [Nippostrongylus brasiliensis]|uniref:proteasome endopeptidase complex n=1 Tax=Nippostrongylus brasiliensis TaxID=27835 RepID=A0A0N4YC70_NIPBR|nr:unnamed protein product [Nippostrongylus brasiliensis]